MRCFICHEVAGVACYTTMAVVLFSVVVVVASLTLAWKSRGAHG